MSDSSASPALPFAVQDAIRRELERKPFLVRLPGATGALYAARAHAAFVRLLRGWWPALAAGVVLIIGGMWLLFHEVLTGWDGQVWWTLVQGCSVLYALMIALLHLPAVSRHYIPVLGICFTLIQAGVLGGTLLFHDPQLAQTNTYLVMLTDFVIILCVGLPPLAGLFAGLAALGLAAPGVLALGGRPDWVLVQNYHVLVVLVLFFEAMLLERTRRLSFLQELLLDQQNLLLDEQNYQLERRAHQDALTGLSNRRHFDQVMAREWERMLREQQPLAVLMLDVDHFKLYNDHYGHGGGDLCLGRVGDVLKAAVLRPADLPARYGGEEFVVLLPNTDRAGAAEVAARILLGMDTLALPHAVSPVSDHVTLSIGYAATVPAPGDSALALLKAADQALYAAKHAGRHRATAAGSTTQQAEVGRVLAR